MCTEREGERERMGDIYNIASSFLAMDREFLFIFDCFAICTINMTNIFMCKNI